MIEVIEIAIKKPFNLIETVEKGERSSTSKPPKLPRMKRLHIGIEAIKNAYNRLPKILMKIISIKTSYSFTY